MEDIKKPTDEEILNSKSIIIYRLDSLYGRVGNRIYKSANPRDLYNLIPDSHKLRDFTTPEHFDEIYQTIMKEEDTVVRKLQKKMEQEMKKKREGVKKAIEQRKAFKNKQLRKSMKASQKTQNRRSRREDSEEVEDSPDTLEGSTVFRAYPLGERNEGGEGITYATTARAHLSDYLVITPFLRTEENEEVNINENQRTP